MYSQIKGYLRNGKAELEGYYTELHGGSQRKISQRNAKKAQSSTKLILYFVELCEITPPYDFVITSSTLRSYSGPLPSGLVLP
jgi:hypothetical protein